MDKASYTRKQEAEKPPPSQRVSSGVPMKSLRWIVAVTAVTITGCQYKLRGRQLREIMTQAVVDLSSSSSAVVSLQTAAQLPLPLCSMEQIKTGAWKPVRLDKPPYIPTYLQWREECYDLKDLQKAPHWDTYEWEPFATHDQNCSFVPWNEEDFCSLTRNKTIAVVGDSLSLEHFNALAHQLGFVGSMEQVWDKGFEQLVFPVCKNQTTLV